MTKKEKRYIPVVKKDVFFIRQLDNLGLNRRYLGYYFLIEIMDLLINKGLEAKSFSKKIYPIISNKYNKSVCTVERNIRNLIDKNWSQELMRKLNIFNPNNNKPSCCEFIKLIKTYIYSQII